MTDSWQSGNRYENFMGRWSSLVARQFLDWLAVPADASWLDVGCGTGSLTRQILAHHHPKDLLAIDSSSEFVSFARQSITSSSARFEVGLAQSLAVDSDSRDAAVSGLMLNFVPEPAAAILEMLRVIKPGGTVGIFLWDYAGGMEMLRYFWDAAVAQDSQAAALDEGVRFPLCRKGALEALVQEVGLKQIEAVPIEVATVFLDFDDYWAPFLGQVGPAPAYASRLSQAGRQELEKKLRHALPIAADGSISLIARAWAVKGTV